MISGFYPGSFDPPTKGHVDVLRRAMGFLDRLVVGIGVQAKKNARFSVEERIKMLHLCLDEPAKIQKCTLEVVSFEGLLVDAVRKYDATLIIRGLRSGADFDYEAQMSAMNRQMAAQVETICLAASPEVAHISSTLVRQIADMKGDFEAFVPTKIFDMIKLKYQ